ncbi:hypothetical protein MVEN_01189200 [Mycena venus]|uniref:Uncharacterized protein n=1 Tax=Mycena venus TaxID=2733690 RepID=A0A8H7CVV8_9AGAR|nr:hypothetical protein MVEN_01189200 [Mycena venus]
MVRKRKASETQPEAPESNPALIEVDSSKEGRKARARKAPDPSNAEDDVPEQPSPPKKKSKSKNKAVEEDEFAAPPASQESEFPSTLSPKPATRKSKKKKSVEEPVLPEYIILLVPTVHGASQCISVPYQSDFDDASLAIFDAVPCSDIPVKPTLSYRLTPKSGKILLNDNESWSSLRAAAVARLNQKKKNPNDYFEVCLAPDNYLASVQYRNNPKSAKKGGKRAKDVIDLDHNSESDEDDVGEEISVMEKEQEKLGELERKHQGKCQKCAADQPEVWCKIDKSGAHTPITYVMRNSWAHSLALEEHGITLDNPPNTPLFSAFHKKHNDPSLNNKSTTAAASGSTSTSTMMDVFMMGMMEQSKMNTALLATITNGSSIRRYPSAGSPSRRPQAITAPTAALPAADTHEAENEDIGEFFDFLDSVDSRRSAGRYLDALIAEEVFTVGDIIRQGKVYLESSVIGMKSTLASWVVDLAQKRVR